jgi:DNA-directed RNA polymerase specialized sigma24 family protein
VAGVSAEPPASSPPSPPTPRDGTGGPNAAARAFDQLHARHAPALTRQAFLLTGHRSTARRAVAAAFRRAWANWPEVALDADPGGWVRAAAYEYALAPWRHSRLLHPLRRARPARGAAPAERPLIKALLSLPRSYRAALLLRDALGLSLPDTAAETEASTAATAGRLRHARQALAERLPELGGVPPKQRRKATVDMLRRLAAPDPAPVRPARAVRRGSELRTRAFSWTSAGVAAVVALAAGIALAASCEGHGGARSFVRPAGRLAHESPAYVSPQRPAHQRLGAATEGAARRGSD